MSRNGHTEAYHITNYTIPFFLWGPGIPGGTDIYDLLANRADPGTNRTDYSVSPQPLRNGDGGNIGLALLGLPPIPGSFFRPELVLNPTMRLAVTPTPFLNITATTDGHVVSWSAQLAGYVLETSADLATWQAVDEVTVAKGFAFHSSTLDRPARFYRLRRQ